MYYLALIILSAVYAYSTVTGAREYKAFQKLKDTNKRQYYYTRWTWEAWLLFGLVSVVVLVALGNASNLLQPVAHMGLVASGTDTSDGSFVAGLAVGLLLAAAILIFRARRSIKKRLAVGNTDALVPRNSKERRIATHLAIASGIGEELFFRAALPVVLFAISKDATIALGISIVLFGLMHIYQGWRGVLATAVAGWVFTKAFTLSGTILAPMAIHVLLDMWGLVIVPYIMSKQKDKIKG